MHPTRSLLLVALLLLTACGTTAAPPPAAPEATAVAVAPTVAPTQVPPTAVPPTAVPPTEAPTAAPTEPPAAPTTVASDAVAPPFTRLLQRNDPPLQGDDVLAVQKRLAQLGYQQPGQDDGVYGLQTEGAVRAFQTINSLTVDGITGPATWKQLFGSAAVTAPPVTPVMDLELGYLMGGSAGSIWLDGGATAGFMKGGETYRVLANGTTTEATGDRPAPSGMPCEYTFSINLAPKQPEAPGVAIGGTGNAQPRPVTDGDPTDDTTIKAVAKLLISKGISKPDVNILRVLTADIDGDGTTETLVEATRTQNTDNSITPDANEGDYSTMLLLPGDGGAPIELDGDYHPKAAEFIAPLRLRLIGIYDLNNDGQMEVVVAASYYEGASVAAYEIRDGKPTVVLQTGCGV